MKNKDILNKVNEIDVIANEIDDIKETISNLDIDLTSEKVTMQDGRTLQTNFDELKKYVMEIEVGARFT
ncbi:MAG: hypothetical protein IJH34_09015 [Romboutsia sp.]|nr:hypothetical protein [Romboutsia sp.]